MRPRVLVINDDVHLCESLTVALDEDFDVHTAATGEEGLTLLQRTRMPIVLLDLGLPGMPGPEVLTHIKELDPRIDVLTLTATNEVTVAGRARQKGGTAYLTQPFDVESLRMRVCSALACYRAQQSAPLVSLTPPPVAGLVGQSPALQRVSAQLHAVADTSATVLLIGESGTGKELFARALHQASPRRHRPFVAINCAAILEGCVASTFFGHTRGAFTGATQSCKGVFARAHTGSLFLDEVSGLSLAAQGALLRVLQERQITRLGSTKAHAVDVRLIAATNQDLQRLVRAGTFREDLLHRLAVIPITIPPLRERSVDIPPLIAHFLAKYNEALGRQVPGLTTSALEALCHYAWPGNVRELENLVIRLVALGSQQRMLEAVEVHTLLQ